MTVDSVLRSGRTREARGIVVGANPDSSPIYLGRYLYLEYGTNPD